MRSTHPWIILTAVLFTAPAWGQSVPSREPTSTHIFPAGGRRGTTVPVRVGGECFPPGMKLTLWGDGISAPALLAKEVHPRYEPSARRPPRDADGAGASMTYPREWESKLIIATDAPLGPKSWRVSGGWGGTQPRPFLVGDLPEFIETEPNSQPEKAECITLPVVVNGQIAGERDIDFFVFGAKAGEVVVCDTLAARIGSPLDPVVEITDTQGKRMDVEPVRVGTDPVLAFRVPATGDYRVSIANVSFQGGPQYVYRMTVSTEPFVASIFPASGKAGETQEVEISTLTGTGTPRVQKERVAFPTVPGPFRLHHSIALVAGEHAEVVATDDNHSASSARALTAPVSVSGRFLAADEEDWFCFTAKKGEAFTIGCRPFPETSAALPVVALFDAAGKPLAKASAVEGADRCAEIDWTAPAEGKYRLRLRDLQWGTHGGAEFLYQLTLRPARPDFTLHLDPDYVNVVQGGKTEVDLSVRRAGGFTGPIDLAATGLPEGVRFEPARIAEGQTRIKLAIVAKDDVRPADASLHIRGSANIAGKKVERSVTTHPIGLTSGAGDTLFLSVQHKPVFRLTCNEAYQYAHRGTIYPYAMKVERLGDFTGPITIQLCDRQVQDLDGIEVVETVVPAGETEFKNLVYLPETMHVSVQHHSRPYVQGYATFTDKWGQKQTLLAVSEKRCMIRTLPTLVRLRALQSEVTARPGEEFTCKFALDHTTDFADGIKVELIDAAGFSAELGRFEAGGKSVVVQMRVDRGAKQPTDPILRFRASGKLVSGEMIITSAVVAVKLR